VDANGLFLYVVNNGSDTVSVYTIDNTTGALTATGISAPTQRSRRPGCGSYGPLSVRGEPRLKQCVGLCHRYFHRLLTQLSNSPFGIGATPSSLQIDPSGSFLYVTDFAGGRVVALVIDSTTAP